MRASGGDSAEHAGRRWQCLREELAAWLSRRCRRGIDVENVAGDAVVLAMQRFGHEPEAANGMIWRWLCSTSLRRVYCDHRKAMRCAIFCSSDLDALTCCPGVEGTKAAKVVQTMLATTHGVQLRVLQALSLGCVTNEAMAEAIGVDKRTIERARAELRLRFTVLLPKPRNSCRS